MGEQHFCPPLILISTTIRPCQPASLHISMILISLPSEPLTCPGPHAGRVSFSSLHHPFPHHSPSRSGPGRYVFSRFLALNLCFYAQRIHPSSTDQNRRPEFKTYGVLLLIRRLRRGFDCALRSLPPVIAPPAPPPLLLHT